MRRRSRPGPPNRARKRTATARRSSATVKARLLAADFLLHEIETKAEGCKALAAEQVDRPITRHEFLAIQPFRFAGRQNYLPGLKDASLKFSWVTDKPAYRSVLGLTEQQLDIIKDYRLLRNQIHFPGDILETPSIHAYPGPIIEFLTEFINSEVINASNRLIARHNMNFRPLTALD